MARAERKVAHLALDASFESSSASRSDPVLEEFVQDDLMERRLVQRGKKRRRLEAAVE